MGAGDERAGDRLPDPGDHRRDRRPAGGDQPQHRPRRALPGGRAGQRGGHLPAAGRAVRRLRAGDHLRRRHRGAAAVRDHADPRPHRPARARQHRPRPHRRAGGGRRLLRHAHDLPGASLRRRPHRQPGRHRHGRARELALQELRAALRGGQRAPAGRPGRRDRARPPRLETGRRATDAPALPAGVRRLPVQRRDLRRACPAQRGDGADEHRADAERREHQPDRLQRLPAGQDPRRAGVRAVRGGRCRGRGRHRAGDRAADLPQPGDGQHRRGGSAQMVKLAWLVPALPLAAWAVILLVGKRTPGKGAPIGILAVAVGWVLSIGILASVIGGSQPYHVSTTWAPISGQFTIPVGITVDGLAAVLLFVVTTISLFVQVYSVSYMRGDERYTMFFANLSLFTAGMLIVVVADNLLMLLVGWEIMGICSYFLIGHYWEDHANSRAAIKAFLTTRVGDLGFMAGIFVLFWAARSFEIPRIVDAAHSGQLSSGTITLGAVLLFCGAIGKSGQFPLHTWLPDAMAGPTPVSALIHAATMVAAGVFLVAGSVIHSIHTNNLSEMGGLRRAMPWTFATFTVGALALAGIIPLAGFWSKDEILTDAWQAGFGGGAVGGVATSRGVAQVVFVVGVVTAFLTAFYVTRMLWLAFGGAYRGQGHPHEADGIMLLPLVVLATGSVVGGVVGSPLVGDNSIGKWIGTVLVPGEGAVHVNWGLAAFTTVVALLGILGGTALYATAARDRRGLPEREYLARVPPLYTLLERKYFLDDLYEGVLVRAVTGQLAPATYWFDQRVVDGVVNGAGLATRRFSRGLRHLQSGQAQWYAAALFVGVVGLAVVVVQVIGR